MKDFSALIGNDIRTGLQSVRLASGGSNSPSFQSEMQEGIERRAAKRALKDMSFAKATGLSTEHLAANRVTSVSGPAATPGMAQGRSAGMQI